MPQIDLAYGILAVLMEPKVKCLESVESRGVGWHSRSCTVLPLILNGHHSRTNSTHLHPWIFGGAPILRSARLYRTCSPLPRPIVTFAALLVRWLSHQRGAHFYQKRSPIPYQVFTSVALLVRRHAVFTSIINVHHSRTKWSLLRRSWLLLAAPGCAWLLLVVPG
jgi:hypothetical protein